MTEPAIVATSDPGYSYLQLEENRRVIASFRSRAAGDNWNAIANFVRASVTLSLIHI